MADVFISYARSERGIAQQIATRLERSNISVFFDVDRLEVGEVFSDRIDAEVKRCGAVLGLWSPLSLSRPWVKLECDIGQKRGVLIPAAVKQFTDMDVPAAFWNVQYIDFTHLTSAPTDPNWILLLKSLARHLGRADLAQIEQTVGAKAAPLEDLYAAINSAVDDRFKASESRSTQEIAEAHSQINRIAKQLGDELETQRRLIEERLQLDAARSDALDDNHIDRLADRLDERVRESERRSASAIGQIGEQVARAVERLQSHSMDSMRMFEHRLSTSASQHEARMDAVLMEVQALMDQTEKKLGGQIEPIGHLVSTLVKRIALLEAKIVSVDDSV